MCQVLFWALRYILLVLSDAPAQSSYNQLIPNTCVHGEARVIEILSHFHTFRQWVIGSIISLLWAVFFICLIYSPSSQNMCSKKNNWRSQNLEYTEF